MTDPKVLRDRILGRVAVTDGGCWRWSGCIAPTGYGQMKVGGRARSAHRVSYETFVGPIPEGLHIDHLCRTRDCVNPAHLEPVTLAENTRRGWDARLVNVCGRGHDLSEPANVYPRPGGGRACRPCALARAAARRSLQNSDDPSPEPIDRSIQ